jgi:FKBP-type peptidyl-prolyl cis-trans isomerase FkpA
MKKYALPLVMVSLVTLQACNQKTETAPAAPAADTVALDTTEQRLSYGIAFGLGQRMVQDGVPVDAEAFAEGFRHGAEGTEPRMTEEEIAAEMQAFQEKIVAEQQATQAALGEANLVAANAYLEENKAREGVVVTESGLQYEVLEAGEGSKPGPEDTVEVHYRGTLVDGTEFDSSYGRGQTVSFGVGQVIAGWTEALQLMPVGSKYRLVIPPELGYGAGGAGQMIGPNSALIFEVELVSIPSQVAAETAPAEAAAE